ncbi:MAG: anaerobic ribonucleoside-triphosphate reductase activating protein [Candidatus Moranbacteria bacterium]|nr:anaerobic ribonucleoside-triphosphate reductase activating protein [Candidatus Moranbacteria bacterium]
MRIAGFEPLTLIDYPDILATVVFTPGCALRCPYCHNPELISTVPGSRSEFFTVNREDEFFAFLEKRRGLLDGVVITGGEPTLHPNLLDFIRRVKAMGFLVKLDTNGIFPDKVTEILATGLVDHWAMDIKHSPKKYPLASGVPIPIERFQQSARLLMKSGASYEFRTTVVPGIHEPEDFIAIGKWIAGATNYYLQAFRSIKIADESLRNRIKGKTIDLKVIRNSLLPYLPSVGIRE